MTELTYIFAVVAALTGLLATICIWSPRRSSAKVMAIGATAALLPAIYLGFVHLLSMPKPVQFEWWHARAAEATVLGSSMREGDGIYLWLQLEDAGEPRAYVLPWSRDLAEQLQAASREAERSQGHLRMRLPFERSLDDHEPKFYALPQPMLPSKDDDPEDPLFYQQDKGHEA